VGFSLLPHLHNLVLNAHFVTFNDGSYRFELVHGGEGRLAERTVRTNLGRHGFAMGVEERVAPLLVHPFFFLSHHVLQFD